MISFNSEQRFIVIGASSGIGEATALLLNELGASVIGIGRNQERLNAMKAKAKHPENIFLEQKDLAEDIDGLPAYVKSLKDKYGKFSGMAYCAGIGGIISLQSMDVKTVKHTFDVNYLSALFLTKGFADRRVNIGKGASVVAIASIAANVAEKGQIAYAGSKAALITSMKTISHELSSQHIRVNTISPSTVETPMLKDGSPDYFQEMAGNYPFGFGKPADVANMTAFLLSDKAAWITGQNYVLDCGAY